MSWQRINCLGMIWTAIMTFSIFFLISHDGVGGLDRYRMVNTVLLVPFSFVVLAALFSALGSRFRRMANCATCMLAVGLAWVFCAPLVALINTGGNISATFVLSPGDWLWALVPVLAYVASIFISRRRNPGGGGTAPA